MNRGDRRDPLCKEDADHERFPAALGAACVQTGWPVHAYCLMANPFHLAVETPQGNLVAGMKWFPGTYTARFNRRHPLFGHLFSGRSQSRIADGRGDGDLKTVCDYVHFNPARLLAELPAELETAREAAAYAGVTPRRNESGASVRRSSLSRQGKASVRPGLYLAALNAFRFNAPCQALAARLLAKGMTKKAVIVAVMHKLLRIAFGVLKHQKPFDPKWAEAAFSPLASASPA